ncbi:MAG: flagellar filament capping protein FliD [Desulfovibrionales bacterium]
MTNDLLSGQIHFAGLGSGSDFDSMITKLVEIEGTHTKRLEASKMQWQNKVASFQELNSAMLSLKTSLSGMDTVDKFLAKSATSSNEDLLAATAGSDAAEGTYNVVINQLARNDIFTHAAGEASTTADITGETDAVFDYTYGTTAVSVDVPSGTTLDGLVARINNDADNPGVRASTVFDGERYHLQIRGLDQGLDNKVAIADTTTLAGYLQADFQNSQKAQNAQIRVDGYPLPVDPADQLEPEHPDYDPDAGWIARSSNSIDDVIPGMTLNLKGPTGDSALQVSVARDTEAIAEQVRTFVTEVNGVLGKARELTQVDESAKENAGSILTGNYGVQMVQQNLKQILAGQGLGLDHDSAAFINLASIGITTDAQEGSPTRGELLLDEAKLMQALEADPDAVAALFSADFAATTDSPDFSPADSAYLKGVTEAGTYDIAYEMDASENIIAATINGEAATIDNTGKTITANTGPASGLSIQVQNLTQGSYTGTLALQQGKAGELQDELSQLTDGSNGTLRILERNYNDIVESIDRKIESEADRIASFERNLRNRFARLESLLGHYDQLTNYLTSQIKGLSSQSGK